MSEDCLAICWLEDEGRNAECSLEWDHEGPHVDIYSAREW